MSSAELQALVNSSNHLLGLQRKLTKNQAAAAGMPRLNPLRPAVLDERYGSVLTRSKKSALQPQYSDRMTSEYYPLPAPRIDFISGASSRLIGREPAVY